MERLPGHTGMVRNQRCEFLPVITIAFLMLLWTATSIPVASASEPPEDGSSITISDAQTWDSDDNLMGNVTITTGGSLEVSARIAVGFGSNLLVQPGGSLSIVAGGELNADDPPSALLWLGYSEEADRSAFRVPTEDVTGSFDLTIHSMHELSMFGFTAHLSDGSEEELNGSSHTFSFPAGNAEAWISFTGYSFGTLAIDTVTIDPTVGLDTVLPAADLDHRNWRLAGDPGFSIEANGDLLVNGGRIMGADVSVEGSMRMSGGVMNRTGPISIGEDGSLNVTAGIIDGSRTDHDIRAGVSSSVTIDPSVTSSGGHIDIYERIIVDQRISFPAYGVRYIVTGLGPDDRTSNPTVPDMDGTSLVDSGGERTISILYANRTLWTEDATITIQEFRTAWNPNGGPVGDYGGDESLSFDQIHQYGGSMPMLTVSSIEPETNIGNSGKSIEVEVRVSNSGLAAAHVGLKCTIDGTDDVADVGGFPEILVPADGTATTTFRWSYAETGSAALSCGVLTPTQLIDENAWGGDAIVSDPVAWVEPVEEESSALAFVLATLFGVALLTGWLIQTQRRKGGDSKSDVAEETMLTEIADDADKHRDLSE